MIAEIDISIRKGLSFLFRILILAYCWSILFRFENLFDWKVYAISFVIYIILYLLCFGKNGRMGIFPMIRLFNDYALFYIVLIGKPISDPHAMILLLLPIINALNHSGERRTLFHSFPMYSIALLSMYLLDNYKLSIGMIVAVLSLGVINVFLNMRVSILNYVEKLNSTFEDYNIDPESKRKHHKLLISLVEKFRQLPLTLRVILFSPDSLVCFRLINKKLAIKSSSEFIFQSAIENEKELLEQLIRNEIVFNHTITIDEKIIQNNVFVQVPVNKNLYVFMFVFNRDEKTNINKYFIKKFLKSPLVKVARIIDYENKLKGQRRKILEQYKSKFKMLEDTRDTLHLIKNKLTPVYIYFDLLKRQETRGGEYEKILKKTRGRVASNLQIIKTKSTPYLDKRLLFLHDSELEQPVRLKSFYSIVIDSFQEEMESNFSVRIKSILGLDRTVNLNIEMLHFLLSELAMNADKHAIQDSVIITFSFESDYMKIIIQNQPINYKNKDIILKSFNKEEVSLTLEKHFNGLTILKKYLIKLGFENSLKFDDNEFLLELKIKTYESSNI